MLDLCNQCAGMAEGKYPIGIGTVLKVWNAAHQCSASAMVQSIADSPLHAQIALAAVIVTTKVESEKKVVLRADLQQGLATLGLVESRYKELCKQHQLSPSPFQPLVDVLVALQLVAIKRRVSSRQAFNFVVPAVLFSDLRSAAQQTGNPTLAAIFESFDLD